MFPPIEPRRGGWLPLDERHRMYWEECGAAQGQPVLYLHGGPGDGCAPACRQLFDPQFYRVVLFDQRGCGRSLPRGEWRDNTTAHLLQDIERLRVHLGIERWLLFGGSWGSTLALAYAEAYPDRVQGLLLRGVFLGRQREIDWFLSGMGRFFPAAWQRFAEFIPAAERHDLLAAYLQRLLDDDPAVHLPAARAWAQYEAACVVLWPNAALVERAADDALALPLARLEAYYFANRLFLEEGQLLAQVERIRHLPCVIVQGRYDVVCPPQGAHELARAWPEAECLLVEGAGHSMWEPAILQALLVQLARFRQSLG